MAVAVAVAVMVALVHWRCLVCENYDNNLNNNDKSYYYQNYSHKDIYDDTTSYNDNDYGIGKILIIIIQTTPWQQSNTVQHHDNTMTTP